MLWAECLDQLRVIWLVAILSQDTQLSSMLLNSLCSLVKAPCKPIMGQGLLQHKLQTSQDIHGLSQYRLSRNCWLLGWNICNRLLSAAAFQIKKNVSHIKKDELLLQHSKSFFPHNRTETRGSPNSNKIQILQSYNPIWRLIAYTRSLVSFTEETSAA